MANPAKTPKRGGGVVHIALFRVIPILLSFAALFVAALKIAPYEVILSVTVLPPEYLGFVLKLSKSDWIVVIFFAVAATVISFVGSLFAGRMRAADAPVAAASVWKDGQKIDKTKCAKSSCRRMRLSGKMLCPECWDEWQRQTPRLCAECNDENISQNATIPLCKLCHQRWVDGS